MVDFLFPRFVVWTVSTSLSLQLQRDRLGEMIENEKKARLFRDLDEIEANDKLVEMQF